MIFDVLYADGLKSSQADVQGDLGNFDSALANALENFGSEVQAGGGRGYRPSRSCVNRLVAVAVMGLVFAVNVGRQGNVSQALYTAEKIGDGMETDGSLAEVSASDDFGLKFGLALGAGRNA